MIDNPMFSYLGYLSVTHPALTEDRLARVPLGFARPPQVSLLWKFNSEIWRKPAIFTDLRQNPFNKRQFHVRWTDLPFQRNKKLPLRSCRPIPDKLKKLFQCLHRRFSCFQSCNWFSTAAQNAARPTRIVYLWIGPRGISLRKAYEICSEQESKRIFRDFEGCFLKQNDFCQSCMELLPWEWTTLRIGLDLLLDLKSVLWEDFLE